MGEMWNLWHGCHKKSEGCQHCYVYRRDAEFEKDSNVVTKTVSFNLPIRRDRQGNWKVPSGSLMWTCFTSDFFIEEADEWRDEAWLMIKRRNDLYFYIVTKRPERILQCLPDDWGDGYENIDLSMTCENQRAFDERWPIFRDIPAKHKGINLAPLLSEIDITPALGSHFVKDGKMYHLDSQELQGKQAYRSGLSHFFSKPKYMLYHPIDGHMLEEGELMVPRFNVHRCLECVRVQQCIGCTDCGSCKQVKLVSMEQLMEMRDKH